jgi:hypothetical protein
MSKEVAPGELLVLVLEGTIGRVSNGDTRESSFN